MTGKTKFLIIVAIAAFAIYKISDGKESKSSEQTTEQAAPVPQKGPNGFYLETTGVAGGTDPGYAATSGSIPSTSSESSSASSSRSHACPYCDHGYIRKPGMTTYGVSDDKSYCDNCGTWYPRGSSHHCQCKHCGGTGYI